MSYNSIIGSRAEVWHGSAKKTSGGLTKAQLMKNKSGRIVSKKKHFSAKKDNRLVKAGYKTKKGQFGFVKVGSKKRGRGKKMRGGQYSRDNGPLSRVFTGGAPYGSIFSPSDIAPGDNIAGANITNFGDSSTNVHLRASMAGGKKRKMRGGTTSKMSPLSPMNVNSSEARVLIA
uniref:Uncharacterized protein n=1 Tax=viral metagenome TaxID=1070528 RepID=A0A6C0I6Y1_9ZZZZ